MQQNPKYPNENVNLINENPQNSQVNDPNIVYASDTHTNNVAQNTEAKNEAKRETIEKIIQLIWFVAGLVKVVLILRVIFLLFNAQPSGFTSFLYNISNPFTAPFFGIFPTPGEPTGYFDTAALVAMIIYSLIAWGIATLVKIIGEKQEIA